MKGGVTARDLLDCFGRSTLVRLIHERGLATSRENDERRKTLAHSYHGDVESLINDLDRDELITLFEQMTFVVRDEEVHLPVPDRYGLDDLRAFAIRAFVGRRVRIAGEFLPVARDEEGGNEDDDEVGDKEDAPDAVGPPIQELSDEWSRPRMIARVLRRLGRDVPERLRTPRFQELIAELRGMGVEACLADDAACAALADGAESPGIAAKLRLRLIRHTDRDRRAAKGTQEDRSEAARRAWDTRRARSATDAGPPIVVHAGERPVSQRIPRPSDYNLAVLRLQFLTAVPSVQRRTMPEWPTKYLEAATRGLELRPQEATLLRAYSAGLSIGNHSPYEAIPHLSPILSATEWEQLLEDFVALNPFQPEFVQAIVEQIEPITAPRSEARAWRSAEPTPEDLREPGRADDTVREPMAASARFPAEPEPKEEGTNNRNLGALAGMFDDE